MKKFFILSLITLSFGCIHRPEESEKTSNPGIDKTLDSYYLEDRDTVMLSQDFGYFRFTYHEFLSLTQFNFLYGEVHLKESNKDFHLFDDYHSFFGDSLFHAYDNYYLYYFWGGGNNCRASGYHVVKITPDTAFYVGLVCGYDDLDSNGTKEFYYIDIVEYGDCTAMHKVDSFPCEVVHDSMTYPGLYGSYKSEYINIILNKPFMQVWQQAKRSLTDPCNLNEGGRDRDLEHQTLKPWSLVVAPPSLFRKIKIKLV
jgi:hypothetical protein